MALPAGGGHHGGSDTDAPTDPKLPAAMIETKQDSPPPPPPEGLLEVTLTWPAMSGYAGPGWPPFCTLYVGVGSSSAGGGAEPDASRPLLRDLEEHEVAVSINEEDVPAFIRWNVQEETKRWRMQFKVPVPSTWPDMSLDLFVERSDFDRRRRQLVVLRGGPHTSGATAVIARARVPLLDALVIGDLDKEEDGDDDKKKRRRDMEEAERNPRLPGTLEFGRTVPLLDWELPALGDADGEPRSVVRGKVNVRMSLRKLRY